jgi:hypothetical protein
MLRRNNFFQIEEMPLKDAAHRSALASPRMRHGRDNLQERLQSVKGLDNIPECLDKRRPRQP